MNAIQKFAEEHGADSSASFGKTFQDAVQSVIGDKGTVGGAWCYDGSNDYGYNDWEASITGLDGMLPTDEIVIVLSTDLDNGTQWLSGRYMDDVETIAEASDSDEQFDPTPIINQLLAEVQKERSSKAEAKKHVCSMQKKKERLAKKNEDASMKQVCDAALKASNFEDGYWAWTRAEADKITDKVLEEHPELDYDEVWDYVRESIVGHIYDNCNPV